MTPHPSTQGRFLAVRKPTAHNLPVSLRLLQSALLGAALFVLVIHSASADQTASQYTIPADVIDAGGADVSKSNLYLLSDSIGEPVVGFGASDDYILNSGYRQPSASDFISVACSAEVNLGSVPGTGQRTGTGTCMVYTDAYSGYRLIWQAGRRQSAGLLVHWKLDETSGTTAYDSSGSGNNGTLTSGAAFSGETPTKYFSTRSVSVDGLNDHIISDSNVALSGDFEASLSAWVKFNDISSGYKAIINIGSTGTLEGFGIFQGVNSNGSITVGFYGSSNCNTAAGVVTTGQWYHLAATKTPGAIGTASTKLYINGTPQSLTCNTSSTPSMVSGKLYVANDAASEISNSMYVDEARVYSRALSQAAVRELASKTPPGSLTASGSQTTHIPGIYMPFTGGLVGYWRLDESIAGSTAADASGYNNDGTPAGAGGSNNKPQPSTSVPGGANFLTTRSLHFDGTDDVVDTSMTPFSNATAFTLTAWVKRNASNAFVSLGQYDTNSSRVGIDIYSDGNVYLEVANGSNTYGFFASNDTDWHHIAMVYDGSLSGDANKLKGYLDGVAQSLSFGSPIPSSIGSISDPFSIGYFSGRYTSGSIDDVRIYNRALSSEEVKALVSLPQSWSVGADESAWGARISSLSTDTDAKWGTDGTSEKWLNIGDGSYPLVRRYTATPLEGSEELVEFRAEVGSSKIQESGLYTGVATFTVVGY